MPKLVLDDPIDPHLRNVQLDESVVADGLVLGLAVAEARHDIPVPDEILVGAGILPAYYRLSLVSCFLLLHFYILAY